MTERVEPYDPQTGVLVIPGVTGTRWEPNVPEAVMVSDDQGRAALAQRAHPHDADQRCVVLRWDVVHYAVMGPPNDEAMTQHRLYETGLRDVLWLGVVRESTLLERLRPMFSDRLAMEPLHYIVVSKECTIEVLAENVDVFRIAGSTRAAAPACLSP